jgi:hypothetical protein
VQEEPTGGGIPAAIAKRLRSVRYAIGDVFFVIGRGLGRAGRAVIRFPVAIGHGVAEFWHSLSVIARRRLVAALVIAAALLAFFALAVPNLPCQFPGGDSCPPPDDAEELVPADALAYLHANLDPDTDEYRDAADLIANLPVLGGLAVDQGAGLIPSPGGTRLNFDDDIRPWFGGEAAIVVLPGTGLIPERVDLLEVEDSQAAADYTQSLAVGAVETSDYEGIEVSVDQKDVATAEVNGFLAVGTEDGVQAVIATATGADGAESLADDDAADEIRDELPDHRVAEAWLSADGAERLIAADRGTLGTLTPLVAPGSTRGVAASLSASGDEVELAVRSSLDPEREETSPSFFAAFPSFEPDLPEKLQPQTLAYLGIGPPTETVGDLLAQAGAEAPGIAAGFEDLVDKLRHRGDIDLQGDLLDGLGDQAAFTLEPAPQSDTEALGGETLPFLQFVADGVDEDATREALAALQGPLADATTSGDELQAPVFGQEEVDGVETNSLRVSPTVNLTYAVFDGLAAIATDPAGVRDLIEGEDGLDESGLFEDATDDFPDEVSMIAFLNLGDLVAIGEQAGLAEDPRYATFAGDIRRLDGLGLAVSDSDDVLSTDLRLLVSDQDEGDGGEAPPPVAPSGD